jgi:uncharacterized protein
MKMAEISNEPTMEDILSSIKKIISDDSAKALSAPRQRRAPVRDEEVTDAPPAADVADGDDDILELTEAAMAPVADTDTVELISPVVANASKTALDQLSALVVKPEITGTDTLEGMVREMLRPMMKEWLDANLPRVVEAMVAREISRISTK